MAAFNFYLLFELDFFVNILFYDFRFILFLVLGENHSLALSDKSEKHVIQCFRLTPDVMQKLRNFENRFSFQHFLLTRYQFFLICKV